MLAAADAAQYDGPVPLDLQDAWDCDTYHIPFDGTSLMDQPAGKVLRMNIVRNVYNAVNSRQQALLTGMDMKEWSEKNPRAWKIVGRIERMRFDNRS